MDGAGEDGRNRQGASPPSPPPSPSSASASTGEDDVMKRDAVVQVHDLHHVHANPPGSGSGSGSGSSSDMDSQTPPNEKKGRPEPEDNTPAQEDTTITTTPTAAAITLTTTALPEKAVIEKIASVSDEDDGVTYPEGGREAWLVVLGCWLALFSSMGLMNIIATFQTYISTHQLKHLDAGTVGWIFSVYTFLSFFLGVYVGPLFDKYGPRWLIAAGSVCMVVSLMLFSISFELWHFILAFGVLSGGASSLLFTPSIATIGHWFRRRRGLATGIANTGGSLGGVVFPLMLQRLFDRVGWAWAIRILGLVCLALTAAANFLIRARLPPARHASPHPDPRIFLRNRAFALATLATFLTEFALFIPLTYISSYALSRGFTRAFSFDVLTILNAGSVLGRLLPGYWADRLGVFNANAASVAATAAACFALWLPAGGTAPGLVAFALVFGFCSGSNITLIPVAIGRLCRTEQYGRYYGTAYTVVSAAVLVGIPVAGKIIGAGGGDYFWLIVTTALIYCAALAAFVAAKIAAVGWNPLVVF